MLANKRWHRSRDKNMWFQILVMANERTESNIIIFGKRRRRDAGLCKQGKSHVSE